MKYKSELIKDIVESRGHEKSSLHYESECVEKWVEESKGAYPKLTDYQAEWLNYINENPIGNFPYEIITDVTKTTVNNVVPYAYGSAILKGNTKYRDIDTGDILDTFDETKNLELVSVKMPVLTTTGKNIFGGELINGYIHSSGNWSGSSDNFGCKDFISITPNDKVAISLYDESLTRVKTKTYIRFYDINFNAIDSNLYFSPSSNAIATAPTNAKYLKFYYSGTTKLNVQIEQNSIITPYEPYKSNILTVNEEVELRGFGVVKDDLNLLTGEMTKRINEIVLDGSESWEFQNNKPNTLVFKLIIDKIKLIDNHVMSDRFPRNAAGDVEKITNLGNEVYVAILKTKANNLNDFKSYLSQNPMTVQYQLATESIKTVELTIQDQDGNTLSKIRPIEGTMNLTTSSDTIAPMFSGEIPVEATTQNLTSFIKEE